jgi:hypothetical protein
VIIHTYEEITGSGWTVVAFNQPHKVDDVVAIKDWCYKVYGEPMTRWKDSIEYGEVRFEDEKDVMMFILRWQ